MKRILITGANSYIGTSFEKYVSQWPSQYHVDTLDMRGDTWEQTSFKAYDSVFHVAGIAHSDVGKVSESEKLLYYQVNSELPVLVASKAKSEGVRQFIFMSSAIVYGDSAPIGHEKVITQDTMPAPANFYGDSKLKGEEGLRPLQSESFNVVILRPPMIYGKGSKGNYPLLSKYSKKLLYFPQIKNKRSLLYVENLCELVRALIDRQEKGTYYPQNERVVSTSELVKAIARANGKGMYLIPGLNGVLTLFGKIKVINKVFGSFVYSEELSEIPEINYRIIDFETSIERTES